MHEKKGAVTKQFLIKDKKSRSSKKDGRDFLSQANFQKSQRMYIQPCKMLEGELEEHLGYEKNSVLGNNSGNSRNGYGKKTVKSEWGESEITFVTAPEESFIVCAIFPDAGLLLQ